MPELLLVSPYYASHRGGVELAADRWGRQVRKRWPGWNLRWAASQVSPGPTWLPEDRVVPMPTWNHSEERLGIPLPVWKPQANTAMREAVGRSDVMVLHEPMYPCCLHAFSVARRHGVPVVLVVHAGEMLFANPLLKRAATTVHRAVGRHLVRRADEVVSISVTTRDLYQRWVGPEREIHVIPNAVDTTIFSPDDGADQARVRAELGLAQKQDVVLFVGRFVERKGIHVMRELVQAAPQVEWWFAGWGLEDPQAWRLPNVRVIKGRDSAALVELYRAADLLVLPSASEGFPLVVQEAMACGLPCLVGNDTHRGLPGVQDWVPALPVDPAKPADTARQWAAAINAHLSNLRRHGARRSFCPQSAAKFARDNWNWDNVLGQYRQVLARALATRAAAPEWQEAAGA